MKENADKLRDLLKHWKDIEPRASFEADVRRRIRLAGTTPAGWLDWWQGCLWKPALSMALAVVASALIGAAAGIWSAPRPHPDPRAELQFMSGGTLSGGYVKLASGGWR